MISLSAGIVKDVSLTDMSVLSVPSVPEERLPRGSGGGVVHDQDVTFVSRREGGEIGNEETSYSPRRTQRYRSVGLKAVEVARIHRQCYLIENTSQPPRHTCRIIPILMANVS